MEKRSYNYVLVIFSFPFSLEKWLFHLGVMKLHWKSVIYLESSPEKEFSIIHKNKNTIFDDFK